MALDEGERLSTHFVNHKSRMDDLGTEIWSPWWERDD